MNTVDIHHLAAAYALDAVDDHERVIFEAHYETCELCQDDVAEFRSTMAIMGEAQPIEPSQRVAAAVMRTINETRQLSPIVPARPVAQRLGCRRFRAGAPEYGPAKAKHLSPRPDRWSVNALAGA